MADKSGIQWTDATWNPTTGCDRVSPGCANCYALTFAPRLQAMAVAKAAAAIRDGKNFSLKATDPYMRDGDPKTSGPGFGLQMHESRLDQPLRWARPRRIFVNSMSDLFHPEVTNDFLDRVFSVMAVATQHTFQVLTKRPERMREYITKTWGDGHFEPTYDRSDAILADLMRSSSPVDDRYVKKAGWPDGNMPWPLPNVWLGTSVENARWRTRIDDLRQTPAAVRFLSCEPLLGPLTHFAERTDTVASYIDLTGIGWVIIGGESGPGARPMDEQWVRDIVAACREQGAAPFVKQMGEVWSHEHLGHSGHGGDIDTFPEDLRVRDWPKEAIHA